MREMLNPLPESRAGYACTDRVDSARQAKVFISKKKVCVAGRVILPS